MRLQEIKASGPIAARIKGEEGTRRKMGIQKGSSEK